MKRYLSILITALLVFSLLCGCGQASPEQEQFTREELSFTRDGMHIAGELFLPMGAGPFPSVILCPGYGGNMQSLLHYGEFFASRGIAACAFDFIGGGPDIRSDGTMMDMTVLTEAADLNAVMDALLERPELDGENLFLIGFSQGGVIATYVAAERPEDVKGLLPIYPGYGFQDGVRMVLDESGEIPENVVLLGRTVSRQYVEDALSFDLSDCMRAYSGPVRIIHGTGDVIAPILYSNRAVKVFPSAEVVPIKGANHGFRGEDDETAMDSMLEFIQANVS